MSDFTLSSTIMKNISTKKNKPFTNILLIITTFLLITTIKSGPVIKNNPITFAMSGTTTYIPDGGGASKSGYKLKVGFTGYQWLAV